MRNSTGAINLREEVNLNKNFSQVETSDANESRDRRLSKHHLNKYFFISIAIMYLWLSPKYSTTEINLVLRARVSRKCEIKFFLCVTSFSKIQRTIRANVQQLYKESTGRAESKTFYNKTLEATKDSRNVSINANN